MIGYKLFRVRRDGSLGSLFIQRQKIRPLGRWLRARSCPTPGFAVRPGWHVLAKPEAPHLTMKGRAWYRVEIANYVEMPRPQRQGGMWYLAKSIKILEAI